jgi:hypothetical protein
MKKVIAMWFLFLLTLLWMTSCGTRDTKKTEVKEEVKTEIEASTKVEESTKTETKTETNTVADVVEQNENLTPVDPSKPMTKTVEEKDGKKITTYENANVSSGSKTDKSVKAETKKENSTTDSKAETDLKATHDIEKSEEVKATESNKGFALPYWWIWVIATIVISFLIYESRNKKS